MSRGPSLTGSVQSNAASRLCVKGPGFPHTAGNDEITDFPLSGSLEDNCCQGILERKLENVLTTGRQ